MIKVQALFFCMLLLVPSFIYAQLKNTDCNSIKKGQFYFYPPNSQKGFLIVRNNFVQKEINLSTGDTSFWKVDWQTPCLFHLTFMRKSKPISNEELSFLKSHQTAVEILQVTKDFYVFKGGLTDVNTSRVSDTLWLRKKLL